MYKKVSTSLDFVNRELEVLDFWKKEKIFEETVSSGKGKPKYTFYEGPPTANGRPHIGHILTRCIKDIIPRYRTMKGYDVLRKAGWDTHGLPVELEVEKLLGLDGKEQIEQYGVIPFLDKCKESVWKYKSEWEEMSDRVGFFVDMDDPYVTYENDYIESEWWAVKTIYEKGLLYKGHKVVPYCPRCGTALSSHEVAQGYKDVREASAVAMFKAADEDAYYLAWTTTPWTLPSNVALCVNDKVEYCRAQKDGKTYILAKELAEKTLGEGAVITETFAGKTLVGRKYEPLFDFTGKLVGDNKAHIIISDGYVTTTEGTGIVHTAPAFGEDDARVCSKNGLAFIQLVSPKGEMTSETPWAGMFVKDADGQILNALKESGKLFSSPEFEHSYPFCWRCDTPLIYYARESWFIRMTAIKDKLIEYNRRINWIPDTIKEGRMGNFLENVVDWGISRERYWGTPLPVWVCSDCGEIHVIGSRGELRELCPEVPEDIELHKPYLDPITFACKKCGGKAVREPAVMDCWFDSGSMPFAQWHYPFENQDKFHERYPANFISEALDQTRGWFYTLLAISTCIFEEPSYKNCIVMGLVADKDGQKMSKHKGNVIDPWTVLNAQGADAVRWYFYTGSMPWLPSRFSMEAVSECQRKFMGTLWNTYAFYILYAEIDGFDPTKHALVRGDLTAMDRYILSRLNSLVNYTDKCLDNFKITEAGREIQRFTDDLSNWYVRRCRQRYWGSEMTSDKQAAYMTLYTALKTLMLLCAPFVPFISEAIYQNMVLSADFSAPKSVHLCDFPVCDASFIDSELEKNMDSVLDVVVLGRSARNSASVKNRQPLGKMYIKGAALPEEYLDIVLDELNIKQAEFLEDASRFISYKVKPQLRTLGSKYGKLLPKIGAHLAESGIAQKVVEAHLLGDYTVEIDGQAVVLTAEDVLVETVRGENYVTEQNGKITVVLDTRLTPELIEEGYLRELISKVQTMRKDANFEVTDHIVFSHNGSGVLNDIIEKHSLEICRDTLSDSISQTLSGYQKEWDINGIAVTLGVEKI